MSQQLKVLCCSLNWEKWTSRFADVFPNKMALLTTIHFPWWQPLHCPLNNVFPFCVSLQAPTWDPRAPRVARAALAPSRTASCWGWTEPPGTRAVCGVPHASSHSLPPAGAGTPNYTAGAITSGKTPSPGLWLSLGPLTSPELSLSPALLPSLVSSMKSHTHFKSFTESSFYLLIQVI